MGAPEPDVPLTQSDRVEKKAREEASAEADAKIKEILERNTASQPTGSAGTLEEMFGKQKAKRMRDEAEVRQLGDPPEEKE